MSLPFSKPSVQLTGIPGGEAGTAKTIERMRDAVIGKLPKVSRHEGAHMPDIRFLAQQAVSHVQSKDYMGELRAIDGFVRKHVRYTLDPRALEWVQTPWWTALVIGQGDCDDHATLLAALAVSLGHGAGFRTVMGDKSRPGQWTHIYAIASVRHRGKTVWVPMDTTEKNGQFGRDPRGSESMTKKNWIIVPA